MDLEDILSLRRHEKDFFLRNDPAYAAQLNQLANALIATQEQADHNEMRAPMPIITLLTGYRNTFNELIALEASIGRKDHSGLWGEMDQRIASLSGDFFEASKRSEAKAASILNRVQVQFVITGLICMLLSLLLSYWIASRISRPIRKLSQSMDRF
ncbi:MAG: hypothetical protein AAGB22_05790, partial [Bacteroidota bacterium]